MLITFLWIWAVKIYYNFKYCFSYEGRYGILHLSWVMLSMNGLDFITKVLHAKHMNFFGKNLDF